MTTLLRTILTAAVVLLAAAGRASAQPLSITDDLGRIVSLQGPARRVVSLAPSITESLFAIGAGNRLVGVTVYCNYPDAAQAIMRVGGLINPNLEAIIAQRPDLILMSMEGNTREDFDRLGRLGIPLFVSNPRTMSGIYRSLEQIGTLTGHPADARRLVDSLERRVAAVTVRTGRPAPRTLLFVSLQPLIAAGSGTFVNELLRLAGAANLAGAAAGTYPLYNREAILAADPDVIIVTSDILTAPQSLTALFPEWSTLSAVRHRRVVTINPDIVSRPGPRAVDGLEVLSQLLHAGTP